MRIMSTIRPIPRLTLERLSNRQQNQPHEFRAGLHHLILSLCRSSRLHDSDVSLLEIQKST